MDVDPLSFINFNQASSIEAIYSQYQLDPSSVDKSWRYFFEGMAWAGQATYPSDRVSQVIDTYRRFGHLLATDRWLEKRDLKKWFLPLSDQELNTEVDSVGFHTSKKILLKDLIDILEQKYAGDIGFEYQHCDPALVSWLQEKIEKTAWQLSADEKYNLFEQLARTTLFEEFLHTHFVGQKRFSVEGAESLIPMLLQTLNKGGQRGGLSSLIIGMAHRGRLNVLAHVLGKSYASIIQEFQGKGSSQAFHGDVKYHQGYSSNHMTTDNQRVHVSLCPNPSHLESVSPVVLGRAYAQQQKKGTQPASVLGVVIHGDAAIAGQGVVYEMLQLSQVPGYCAKGVLHLIIDNQIGFTTSPAEYQSTHYCTDIALAFNIPIFHVQASLPEACLKAMEWALQTRNQFGCDVFVHLIGYRKHGHNESDEPLFTQPLMYQHLAMQGPCYEGYAKKLEAEGIISDIQKQELKKKLQQGFKEALEQSHIQTPEPTSYLEGDWKGLQQPTTETLLAPVDTTVDKKLLQQLAEQINHLPEGVNLHPKIQKLLQQRLSRIQDGLDWSFAEQLSFASLLVEGHDVRLSGEDCKRGTFTQRQAIWFDQQTGQSYCPLAHLGVNQGLFTVLNSPLSEMGVLAFELGYSWDSPNRLTLWEAQFGDFVNGAQIIIDQYLAATEQKWARYSGLVLLLPHGYEGQGAEHSSARIERFLQLCAQNNLQVCYPSTPKQYFHLLRRQLKRPFRLPLIVFTPKALLRHPGCVSSLDELAQGSFEEWIYTPSSTAHTLLLCSGKIYFDLLKEQEKRGKKDFAIARVEQLYPLDPSRIEALHEAFSHAQTLIWVQEEPRNMGAGGFLEPFLQSHWHKKLKIVARPASAPAATGSYQRHEQEVEQLMNEVFES